MRSFSYCRKNAQASRLWTNFFVSCFRQITFENKIKHFRTGCSRTAEQGDVIAQRSVSSHWLRQSLSVAPGPQSNLSVVQRSCTVAVTVTCKSAGLLLLHLQVELCVCVVTVMCAMLCKLLLDCAPGVSNYYLQIQIQIQLIFSPMGSFSVVHHREASAEMRDFCVTS